MRTNDLLATGGVLQEGGTKDPVSGNDVPAGALKEEVRDDVPAQLSPGEFVFPADVTRYIGLDKLMQIRDAAKEGLKDMDNKGQMGNSEEVSDDAVGEDKFSSHIDDIIAGLDEGGGEPKKFATGGSVNTSDYSAAPIKGFKMVQYEDVETKAVKYIPFINGKPLLPIPTGYTEKKAAVTPTTPPPPATTEQAATTTTGGGGGNAGGKSTETEGGGAFVRDGDTGVEGFGDIAGGTNPMVARAAGFVAGLVNPFVGLLVSAAGQYATKENNKKVAAANVKAMDVSSLASMGFDAKDIKAAQDAVATATLAGKNAKEIAVAAANAVAASNPNKTSLDGLIAVTKGWNTATPEQMKADAMPDSLKSQIPKGTWDTVVKGIKDGLTPEQAVDKAAASYGLEARKEYQSTFDAGIKTLGTEEREMNEKLDQLAGEQLGVPAGEYNNVINDMKDGYSAKEAVLRAEERAFGLTDTQLADKDTQTRQEATAKAEKIQADREATVQRQEAERVAADQKEVAARAAVEAAKRESEYAAERAAADQKEADSESNTSSNGGGIQSTHTVDSSWTGYGMRSD